MAQERIEIFFKPTGDKALIRAIKELDSATKNLQGRTSIYDKELRKLRKSQKKVNTSTLLGVRNFRNLGKSAGKASVKLSVLRSKLLIASFAIALVTKAMSNLFNAMIVQENAQKKLDTALGSSSQSLTNYAAALQKVTTFGDEEIINAKALIAAYTNDETQIKRATVATLDLAAAKGMDLNTAADLVGKSFGSSTNALSRYGIEVEGAVGSTKRLNMITQNISELYGGQATAAAETFGGQLQQMKNAIGDVNEAIGFAFAPQIQSIIKFLTEGSEKAREFFMGLGETGLETSARQLEEMGANTDRLRLSMAEMDLSAMTTEFGEVQNRQEEIQKLQKELNSSVDEEVKARQRVADKQLELTKNGETIGEINARAWRDNDKVAISKLEQLESLKNEVTLAELAVDGVAKKIEKEEEYNQKLQEIHDLQLKAGIMLPEVEVTARAKAHTRILKFFEDMNVKTGEYADEISGTVQDSVVNVFDMTDEMAKKTMEILNQVGEMAAESANERVAAIDMATNKQIEDEKKTRKFQKMSSKEQEKFEKDLRDKAEKDKIQAKKKANQIKAAEFRINQALRLKEAIMNTAKEVAGHVGNPFMQAFTYAMGAAQIAIIASQKPPKFAAGGLVGGRRHSQGGTMIEAEQGEFVMNRDAVDAIGAENLNRMNRGGGGGANISFSGNVMSDDFIENEAIPKIKEAVRRGSDIGVS